ncbi:MAG TPA: hypothetical protein DCO79_15660 [Spirochaeta sp.]|nr:hypothetical protein [Spirochaeta sp.]
MTYEINSTECTFCGLCAADCPSRIITIDKNSQTAEIASSGCIECSHCAMICPVGAVRADGEQLQSYPAGTAEFASSPDAVAAFEHLIKSKRSVRSYKEQPIDPDDLKAIISAGELTATASNSRQVKSIVLLDNDVRKASLLICGILKRVVDIGLSPAGKMLIKLAGLGRYGAKSLLEDYRTRIEDTFKGSSDAFFFQAPAVVVLTYPAKGKRFGRTDCALAGENMMLTAHARGISACMIGFAEAALFTKKLRRKVGVPADRRIGLVFTLGYSSRKYYRYPKRESWEA